VRFTFTKAQREAAILMAKIGGSNPEWPAPPPDHFVEILAQAAYSACDPVLDLRSTCRDVWQEAEALLQCGWAPGDPLP
jgi:hypothetical protein